MDGGGEGEYTRDPTLLSPNDPHQSTSTSHNKQQQRRKTDLIRTCINIAQGVVLIKTFKRYENIVDYLGQRHPSRRPMMAIMGLWCLCAYPHTLLTFTPLHPLNHIRISSFKPLPYNNTFFTIQGGIQHYCQAIALRTVSSFSQGASRDGLIPMT